MEPIGKTAPLAVISAKVLDMELVRLLADRYTLVVEERCSEVIISLYPK